MSENWFLEKYTPHTGLTFAVKERLYKAQSEFQNIEVLDTFEFGRILLLDGCVMLTDRDEFIYHEMIVHPAMLTHADPRRVLIIGGGDGGSIRETLRHPTLESIHLVEIDKMVIDVSRRFFPALSAGYDDPRVEVFVADGFDHLETHREWYDVIIVDSIDPVGEAAKLFTPEFYAKVKQGLRAGGNFVCQSESPFYNGEVLRQVHGALEPLFNHVHPFLAYIPTYPAGMWSFTFASDEVDPENVSLAWEQDFIPQLKYFTPEIFRASFATPNFVNALLKTPSQPRD